MFDWMGSVDVPVWYLALLWVNIGCFVLGTAPGLVAKAWASKPRGSDREA